MRLTYYGHSAFLAEAADGTRVIIDPYRSGAFGGAFRYAPIDEPADVVLATHEHDDHGAVDTIPGDHRVFVHPASATAGAFTISGVPAAHDRVGGKKAGANTLIILDDGHVRLCHLGDLGHMLDRPTLQALGRVDVLLIPVGGTYTIEARAAVDVAASINPRVVVPMHYKTPALDLPLAALEDFLALESAAGIPIRWAGDTTLTLEQESLPASMEVFVLQHAR
jgi:L-ascorbate metabolism protein UlaG (beta-lactamase superfamily)